MLRFGLLLFSFVLSAIANGVLPYEGKDALRCFAGIDLGGGQALGRSMPCEGQCAAFKTDAKGFAAGGYFCAPQGFCQQSGLKNECRGLNGTLPALGCCCDNADDCNAALMNVTVPPYDPPKGPAIACFSGVVLDGELLPGSGYIPCNDVCASTTYTTVIGGQKHNATLYGCNPGSLCQYLKIIDGCRTLPTDESGTINGCCCSWNDCLDTRNGQVKANPMTLECFVGYGIVGNNTNILKGSSVPCEGKCASLKTNYNDYYTWAFMCASSKVCTKIPERCTALIKTPETVSGCCCDTEKDCNLVNEFHEIPPPTATPSQRTPIACFTGLSLMGRLLSPADSYVTCRGQCVSMSYSTKIWNSTIDALGFTCATAELCDEMGASNGCVQLSDATAPTKITSCCCDTDDCLNIMNGEPKTQTTAQPQPTTTKSASPTTLLYITVLLSFWKYISAY